MTPLSPDLVGLLHAAGAPNGVWLPAAGGERPAVSPDVVVLTDRSPTEARRALADVPADALVLAVGRGRALRLLAETVRETGRMPIADELVVTTSGAIATARGPALAVVVERTRGRGVRIAGSLALRAPGVVTGHLRRIVPLGRGGDVLAAWLGERPSGSGSGLVLVPSWRGAADVVTVTVVDDAGPTLVAKVGPQGGDVGAREADALERIAAAAATTDVRVPRLVRRIGLGPRTVAVQEALPGRPVALGARSALQAGERLARWLSDWAACAKVEGSAEEELEGHVLAPLDSLEGRLPGAYVEAVRRRVSEAARGPAVMAPCHGDLTLWNVLSAGDRLGVVDWEGARTDAVPLVDLPYLLVDAVVAATGCTRAEAVASCFAPGGAHTDWADRLVVSARSQLGVDEAWWAIACDACWLGHADDERRRAGGDTAFLEALARHAVMSI